MANNVTYITAPQVTFSSLVGGQCFIGGDTNDAHIRTAQPDAVAVRLKDGYVNMAWTPTTPVTLLLSVTIVPA